MKDASLPSARSAGWRSRVSPVLSRRYDFLPSFPPRSVAVAWRYHFGASWLRSHRPRNATAVDREYFVRPPLGPNDPVETAGSPKFLGNPDCFCAMFFDSGRTARPFTISVMYGMAPAKGTTRAPTT